MKMVVAAVEAASKLRGGEAIVSSYTLCTSSIYLSNCVYPRHVHAVRGRWSFDLCGTVVYFLQYSSSLLEMRQYRTVLPISRRACIGMFCQCVALQYTCQVLNALSMCCTAVHLPAVKYFPFLGQYRHPLIGNLRAQYVNPPDLCQGVAWCASLHLLPILSGRARARVKVWCATLIPYTWYRVNWPLDRNLGTFPYLG